LRADHRRLEIAVERLLDLLTAKATPFDEALLAAQTAAVAHYRKEQLFLAAVRSHAPEVAGKLDSQHSEATELAAEAVRSLDDGKTDDAAALALRFCALAQHNVIEEERDVFPLVVRWLTDAESARLSEGLAADYDQG